MGQGHALAAKASYILCCISEKGEYFFSVSVSKLQIQFPLQIVLSIANCLHTDISQIQESHP